MPLQEMGMRRLRKWMMTLLAALTTLMIGRIDRFGTWLASLSSLFDVSMPNGEK
jgi:hypothetical protein